MSIRIEVTDAFGGTVKQIVGFVHDRDIVVIQGTKEDGFSVQSSCCLPVNFGKAALHVECMRKAVAAAEQLMANVEFSGTPAALSPEAPLERRVGPGAQED